jgi:hypothetical protein
MNKETKDDDNIRAINNYPEATERMNMLIRRLKNLRDAGTEVFFTAHEDIQQVYAKGGSITPKGKTPQDPIAVKGWPDMPGKRTPDEMCRAADNVFRIRYVNGKPTIIARREPLSSSTDFWEVKDRFNAPSINGGFLPLNYAELKALVERQVPNLWSAPYVWILYGAFGIGKTRFALTVPRPVLLLDLDRGTKSIEADVNAIRAKEGAEAFAIESFDVESASEYPRFVKLVNQCF